MGCPFHEGQPIFILRKTNTATAEISSSVAVNFIIILLMTFEFGDDFS